MNPFFRKWLIRSKQNPQTIRRMNNPMMQVELLEDRIVPSITAITCGQSIPAAPGPQQTFPSLSTITISSGQSIQTAVNAANPGETLLIGSGIYAQNVVIPSSKTGITLEAAPGASVTLQPTSVSPVSLGGVNIGGAAIDISATGVVVSGLTVDGSKDSDGNLWAGIRVLGGGSATITNDKVEGMVNASNPATNVGIDIGISQVSGSQGGGSATVVNTTVLGYAGAGMLVDGPNSTAIIQGNTITGRGVGNNSISEYGVQVSNGATAQVLGNTISGNTIAGNANAPNNPPTTSAGIFIYNESSKVTVSSNTITANDDGVLVQSSNGSKWTPIGISNNKIKQNYGYAGIFVLSSSNVQVSGNTVSNNTTYNGIALNESNNVAIQGNFISGTGIIGSESDGIYELAGNTNQILNNNSNSNSGNGINLQSSSGDTVAGNVTESNTLNGIQDLDGIKDTITLGISSNNTEDGILLSGTIGDSIIGYLLVSNGGSGVQLVDAQNTVIALTVSYGNAAGSISSDALSSNTSEFWNF